MPDADAIRAAVVSLIERHRGPATVIILANGQPQIFQLPGLEPEADELESHLYRYLKDAHPKRLTLPQIVDCLAAEGREFSDRTVQRVLREMAHDGRIDNNPSARPPGYGIRG